LIVSGQAKIATRSISNLLFTKKQKYKSSSPKFNMKLSTMNWLSIAIVLPLFMTIAHIAPAHAEQIGRSRSRVADAVPSVTDLNLSIPVTASEIALNNRKSDQLIERFPANSNRPNSSTTISKKRVNQAGSTSQQKSKLVTVRTTRDLTTPNSVAVVNIDRSDRLQSLAKRKKLVTTSTDPATQPITRDPLKSKSSSGQKIAVGSRPLLSGHYLRLVRDPNKGTNDIGNPIYILETYIDGQKDRTFNTVSGTATTQAADRHRGDNFAPLPDGLYNVSNQIVDGTIPEVGKTFISVFPRFETNRTDLGIHLDPSFNKSNGYDGTAGCIGMTTPADRDAINEFVRKYQPQKLVVRIGSPAE
jgi:hypothetical protein